MSRALRGLWSRRGPLLTLVAMAAVVLAGAVAVMGFAAEAGTSRLLTAPLLLLGAVAVPAIGRELAAARRDEIGLARLRGARGGRLAAVACGEPTLAVLLGAALGVGAGALVVDVDATALAAAAIVALGGLAVVLLSCLAALREPLATQVGGPERPRRAGPVAAFLGVLVLVGAAVAAYRSGVETAGDPDAVVLLGPALVGLAAGQLTVWVLRGLARLVAARSGRAGLAAFLASRRVARADDLVSSVRLLVAAGVVGVLATTGARAVDDWADTEARLTSLGATTVPYDGGAVGALALTRALDPEGEHLMAAALVPGDGDLADRRGYVDSARFARVVGAGLSGTPAEEAGRVVEAVAPSVPDWLVTGDAVSLTAAAAAPRPDDAWVEVRLSYVSADAGGTTTGFVRLPADGSAVSVDLPAVDCAAGCVPTEIAVSRAIRLASGEVVNAAGFFNPFEPGRDLIGPTPIVVQALEFGGLDLVDLADTGWVPVDAPDRQVASEPGRLALRPPADDVLSVRPALPGEVPVLASGGGDAEQVAEQWTDVGAEPVPARVAATLPALPVVGGAGGLGDLVTAVFGSSNTTPATEVQVVASADTPPAMLAELTDATGTRARTLADARTEVAAASGAEQADAYSLMAAFCALVALLALAAGVTRHHASYRRDVAALRSSGIGLPVARRAGWAELLALAAVTIAAVVVGGATGVRLLLDGLPLVRPAPASVPLDVSPDPLAAAIWAAGAALAVVVVGGRARSVRAGGTRPAILREGDR